MSADTCDDTGLSHIINKMECEINDLVRECSTATALLESKNKTYNDLSLSIATIRAHVSPNDMDFDRFDGILAAECLAVKDIVERLAELKVQRDRQVKLVTEMLKRMYGILNVLRRSSPESNLTPNDASECDVIGNDLYTQKKVSQIRTEPVQPDAYDKVPVLSAYDVSAYATSEYAAYASQLKAHTATDSHSDTHNGTESAV